jgi:hypothetical protein
MERVLWKPQDSRLYKEHHCGNCANSIRNVSIKQKEKVCFPKMVKIDDVYFYYVNTCTGEFTTEKWDDYTNDTDSDNNN